MSRRGRLRTRSLALLLVLGLVPLALAADAPEPRFDPELFKALEYRNIGPYRGGRVTAVTGVVGQRDTYYMGSTGGGVWKTTDGGVNWSSIQDDAFGAASVGAVAVAASDPNVVYVGTGTACPRGNVSPGDGAYRSTDAGKTWKHIGLREAGQVGAIRVHPNNPDVVYVAALGHIFGSNEERGVFRSRDGGTTWKRVLYVNERVGAVDLAMDPSNPRILYAAMWGIERKPWTLVGQEEGSGLHRSTDGGDTWEEVTEGLPEGTKGKIGVSISGANGNRVYALVEAEEGGLFRSDDGGKTFKLINGDRNFRQRAWYYTHVFADPGDENVVWIANVGLWKSIDGGKSFDFVRAPHGDHHALWINPDDSRLLINGNDGGANVSYNGGRSWSVQSNQPTAEMYRVSVDDQFPYRVYGCQQDNSCVSLPSRTSGGGIARHDWYVIGGCESGHVAIDPRNTDVSYAGCYGGTISRYDHGTGQNREIMAWPQLAVGQAPRDLKYRFQWNAPIRLSPHDPDVLYHTSQFVHRTTDYGQSWEIISPDLTDSERESLDYAGGPITLDNTGVEVYHTIFSFEESPHEKGVFWAGTDDGRVWTSPDAGKTWNNVTPKQMPERGQVNGLEISAHDPNRVLIAVTRYKFDDFAPYIFLTEDGGRKWKLLTDGKNGIPADHFTRAVREDPDRKGLLYAGTEFGMYVSFDGGDRWQSFQQKLPVAPVTDLQVTQQDLVVATQGRSFWILDDLTPLHAMNDEVARAEVHLFPPRPTYRFGGGFSWGGGGQAGANPPGGVVIHYIVNRELEEDEELAIEILDAEGEVLRKLSTKEAERKAPNPWRRFVGDLGGAGKLKVEKGMNRFVWDRRLHDAEMEQDAVLWGIGRGPQVPTGSYQVRLTLGETVLTEDLEIVKDPRVDVTQADLEAQFALAKRVWEALSESHRAWGALRDVRTQVDDLVTRLDKAGKGGGLEDAAKTLKEKLEAIETSIHQTKSESSQDILNYPPKLDNQLIGLMSIIESADARPTDGSVERFAELRKELDDILSALRAVMDTELATFVDLVKSKDVAPVIVPEW